MCSKGSRWLACATMLAGTALVLASSATPPLAQPSASSLATTPFGLQAAVSAAIDSDNPDLRVVRHGTTFTAQGGGLTSTFGSAGPSIHAGPLGMSLRLAGLGFGPLATVDPTRPVASQNQVTYRHAGFSEWYRNSAQGLEQGFTVARPRRAGAGRLTVAIDVAGPLTAARRGSSVVFTRRGRTVLRYGGLAAVDAAGRALPTRLELEGHRLLLRVEVGGARYPLTIDPYIAQGSRITPADQYATSGLGLGVALSADGNTALVGGPRDNSGMGAAWVFARSGGSWVATQKLVPNDAISASPGSSGFGTNVVLSGDGTKALISGPGDNGLIGAVWAFSLVGGAWQQDQKIVPSDLGGLERFGGSGMTTSMAMSADGSTALIGAPSIGPNSGAVWVYVRSGSTWSEQQKISAGPAGTEVALSGDGSTAILNGSGGVLVYTRSGTTWSQQQQIGPPADATSNSGFGSGVALSQSGNLALIGGSGDTSGAGAVWAFTRSAGAWTEQQKIAAPGDAAASGFGRNLALSSDGVTALIGATSRSWVLASSGGTWSEQQKISIPGDNVGSTGTFGFNLALSGDGSTALIGAQSDSGGQGAAWAFTGDSGWSEQQKLGQPSDAAGSARFGSAVAVSADGNTALIGGSNDHSQLGAAWIFTRSGQSWSEQAKIVPTDVLVTGAPAFGAGVGSSVALSPDGSTAFIGGPNDGSTPSQGPGAVWVYGRSGGQWSELQKITPPSDATAASAFGTKVVLSGDGTTLAISGTNDNNGNGATWVYTNPGSGWSEQAKIPLPDASGRAFGNSLAISSDGNTLLVGGFPASGASTGSGAWVFGRSGTSWGQLQHIASPADVLGSPSSFGSVVGLSGDGATAVIANVPDDQSGGGIWTYTRSGNTFGAAQKIAAPSDETGKARFGNAIAVSNDGDGVLVGGNADNANIGAAWLYVNTAAGWSEEQKIAAPADAIGSTPLFGGAVAMTPDGATALIGANDVQTPSGSGAAWAFGFAAPGLPGAPTGVTASIAGDTSVSVSFAPPDSDGGAVITSYEVTASPGGATTTGSGSPITVNVGSTKTSSFSFTVTATNLVGNSPPSPATTPWPLITSPASGSSTSSLSPTLSGTGVAGATVTLRDGGASVTTSSPQIGAATVNATGHWSTPVTLSNADGGWGLNTIGVTQTVSGQTSPLRTHTLTAVPSAPTLAVTPSAASVSYPTALTFTITGTAATPDQLVLREGATTVDQSSTGTISSFTTTITPSPGPHTYTAVEIVNGVATAASAPVTVTEVEEPPTITFQGQSPSANPNGWNNGPVTLTWACSGPNGVQAATVSQTVSGDGKNQSATGTCTSADGLATSSDKQSGINIDSAAPTITLLGRSPAANANGWNSGPVTVSWACGDPLSGPVDPAVSQRVSVEGAGQSATGTCIDLASNSASNTFSGVNIDTTGPNAPLGTADRPPDYAGDGGWYKDGVTVSFQANGDPGGAAASGVDPASIPAPVTYTSDGASTATGAVTDMAGNHSPPGTLTVQVDAAAPTLSVTSYSNADGSPYLPGTWTSQPVTVTFSCTDSGSGVASVSPPQTVSAEGSQTVDGSCVDNVGHRATLTSGSIQIDRTAPEVYVAFDSSSGAVEVFGRDDRSGVAPGPVSPEDPGGATLPKGQVAYRVVDAAGNSVVVVFKIAGTGTDVSWQFVSITYNGGAVRTVAANALHFTWHLAKGAVKDLTQDLKLGPNHLQAQWDSNHNQTTITLDPGGVTSIRPGLVLVKVVTSAGALGFEY